MVREERNLDWAHCDLSLASANPTPFLLHRADGSHLGAHNRDLADQHSRFTKCLEYLCTLATVLKRKLSTVYLVTMRTSLCSTL